MRSINACHRSWTVDGQTGNHSGPEGRFEEANSGRSSAASSPPRTPLLDSLRVADNPGVEHFVLYCGVARDQTDRYSE
jgi:hypothetical protein